MPHILIARLTGNSTKLISGAGMNLITGAVTIGGNSDARFRAFSGQDTTAPVFFEVFTPALDTRAVLSDDGFVYQGSLFLQFSGDAASVVNVYGFA